MKATNRVILLIVVGGAFLLAIIFWRSGREEAMNPVSMPVPREPNGTKSTPPPSSEQPSLAQFSASKSEPVDVMANNSAGLSPDFRDLIHAKLKQLRETKTEDEKTEEALQAELLALLTDANAGDIVLCLANDELGTPFGQAALGRWLDVDFSDAFRWSAARASTEDGEILLVAKKLVTHSGEIVALCRTLPAGPWRQQLLGASGLEAIPVNHALALTLALQMETDAAQTNVLQTAVYDWMSHDPVAASNWLLQADGLLREQLSLVAAKAVANTDPEMAARWLTASTATEDARAGTTLTIVEIWTSRDPAQTANWVSTFPVGKTRDTAVDLLAREWQKSDSAATNTWIKQLPDSAAILARQVQAAAKQDRVIDPE
jgi:hypothetical protein